MSTWKATSVSKTPVIVITRFQIFRVKSKCWEDETDHIVGWNVTEGEGRVSSAIEIFDFETNTATTKSGRGYKLKDEGINLDAHYTWEAWKKRNKITKYENVTGEYVNSAGV